ncbi:MAG: hypothetical protein KAU50_05200 [Candidatus Marinimicrobia bacterium]|nr:hypothetical protein [Candidatus Neomarinimicrobiota bacterium]
MPQIEDHIEYAKHNESFADSFDLATTNYTDWIVTGKFYAALHYVEACLAMYGEHPENHPARDSHVRRTLPAIGNDYRKLKDDSINARYYGFRITEEEIKRTVSPSLDAIKSHILQLLGPTLTDN